MKLEQQVTSLELSKRLKELGVRQESIFHWIKAYYDEDDCYVNEPVWLITPKYNSSDSNIVDFVSAFTVAELGELLPTDIKLQGEVAWFETRKKTTTGSWIVAYDAEEPCIFETADTEADARAKMLIHLIKNDLLPAPSERG